MKFPMGGNFLLTKFSNYSIIRKKGGIVVDRRKGFPVKKTFKFRLSFFITTISLVLFLLLTFILSIFYQWLLIKKGFLVLGQTGEFLSSAIQNAIISLLIVIAVFLIGIYLIILYIAKRFTGPILRMEKYVKEFSVFGEIEPLKFRATDEPVLHSISEGINEIIHRLESYHNLLKEVSTYLEEGKGDRAQILENIKREMEK